MSTFVCSDCHCGTVASGGPLIVPTGPPRLDKLHRQVILYYVSGAFPSFHFTGDSIDFNRPIFPLFSGFFISQAPPIIHD